MVVGGLVGTLFVIDENSLTIKKTPQRNFYDEI